MNIRVVKPGLLATLQDAGRTGLAHLGIGRAGAFDAPALRIANALCGNRDDACALEMTLLGPTLRFDSAARIAVTGAPVALQVDGEARPAWAPVFVPAGATVAIGAMREGCRGYLAVRGGLAVEPVLGSCSMDINAGLGPRDGKPLQAGDVLEMGSGPFFKDSRDARHDVGRNEPGTISFWWLDPRPWFMPDPDRPLRLLPGTHLGQLTATSRNTLFSEAFTVHADSNRTGLRLTGTKLALRAPIEMVSEGCVPGLVQLPPSGHAIVFGPECPVSGGYPRLGQIAAVDLPRLAQLRPGDALRFQPCTPEDALEALRDRERALRETAHRVRHRLGME